MTNYQYTDTRKRFVREIRDIRIKLMQVQSDSYTSLTINGERLLAETLALKLQALNKLDEDWNEQQKREAAKRSTGRDTGKA